MNELSFQQSGRWLKLNPPSMEENFLHLVKVARNARVYSPFSGMSHLFFATTQSSFLVWGEELKSPIEGEVVEIVNDQVDKVYFNIFLDLYSWFSKLNGDRKQRRGNYIKIKCSNGALVCLSQLMESSIKLKVGDKVDQGQVIAKIGSSGHIVQPCLGLSVELKESGALDKVVFKKLWQRENKEWNFKTFDFPRQSKIFTVDEEEQK